MGHLQFDPKVMRSISPAQTDIWLGWLTGDSGNLPIPERIISFCCQLKLI